MEITRSIKSIPNLNNLGTIGLLITAIASPCCFPLFGFALTALGFGTFELFGGWTMWVFQGLVVLSVLSLVISYRQHQCAYPLLVAVPSAVMIFYSYHIMESDNWIYLLYLGMFGIFISAVVNHYRNRLHNSCCTAEVKNGTEINLKSTITCPKCGHKKDEIMPTDACQYFYDCENCKQILKPKQGDCCVYCSYGTIKCPPMQNGESCC